MERALAYTLLICETCLELILTLFTRKSWLYSKEKSTYSDYIYFIFAGITVGGCRVSVREGAADRPGQRRSPRSLRAFPP